MIAVVQMPPQSGRAGAHLQSETIFEEMAFARVV